MVILEEEVGWLSRSPAFGGVNFALPGETSGRAWERASRRAGLKTVVIGTRNGSRGRSPSRDVGNNLGEAYAWEGEPPGEPVSGQFNLPK